jgi:hypothetical protein
MTPSIAVLGIGATMAAGDSIAAGTSAMKKLREYKVTEKGDIIKLAKK